MRLIESRRVEAADVGQEGGQHTDRDLVAGHQPDAEPQTTSRPTSVRKVTVGENSDQILLTRSLTSGCAVGVAEARHFALFLGEGLDHADAGDGVGQHVGHLRPDAVDLLEAVRRRSRTVWIIQAMKGSGTRVTSASQG
jgi:hypothetical protein